MIDHNGSWLPSITVALPIMLVTLIVLLSGVALGIGKRLTGTPTDGTDFYGVCCGFVAAALTIGMFFGYYPYDRDYHRLQPVTGTVKAVDSRFLAASQYVVITYDTGKTFRCDDSRCATVKPGEPLALLCTKQHDLGSPRGFDGWGCRWGQGQ